MSLSAGTRLGPYEVVSALGAGGMGQVFRARDSRLGRDVAIKSLPASASVDHDLRARFEREARILASLSHPHIASLYGLEESDGALFLILELVEGGTLVDRLAQGPPPLREALVIAHQIADALEAAHEKGIIHRDLKPANVALGSGAHVKVLDFGLAKAGEAGPDAPTERLGATAAGVVLGTAAYMSPEQARGLPVDKRSDIWSFGCVLFELLTGRHPFPASTISDTIAAILHREPDWTLLPDTSPPRVRWLVQRLLEKDPRRRLHDMADARIELEEAIAELSGSRVAASIAAPQKARRWPILGGWLTALAATAAFIWAMAGRGDEAGTAAAIPAFAAAVVLPEELRLSIANPPGRFAISPDGRTLAVVAADASGRNVLWLRPLDSTVARPLAGTDDAAFPFWSPDSRFVAFLASGKLKKVDVAGGAPLTLANATLQATGTWNRDDVILFTPEASSAIHRISASGSTTPAPVTTLDADAGDVQHWYPSFLPDGRRFVYFVVGSKAGGLTDPRAIQVASLDPSEKPRVLVEGGSNARYADGHLIYLRQGTLVARRFNPETLEFLADPVPLVERVQIAGAGTTGVAGAFSVSDAGVLVYQAGFLVKSQLAWLDGSGRPSGTLGDVDDYAEVSLSPDGTRAAVSVLDPSLGTRDIWIYNLARGHRERFTFDPGDDFAPVWSRPDGESLLFSSRRGANIHLYRKTTRGTAQEELLYEDPLGKFASHVSGDGRHLAYVGGGGIIRRSDIWMLPLIGDRRGRPWLETPYTESHPQFSPDGRWMAYTSFESGRPQVYVRRVDGSDQAQVSTAGGGWPRWTRAGDAVIFVGEDETLMSVPVKAVGERLEIGVGRRLFGVRLRRNSRLDAYQYDLAPDGRILVNGHLDELESAPITLLVNWPRMIADR